jgi:hypothetical protein
MEEIDKILNEHDQIEEDLKELEEIMSSKHINYPNLIHTLKEMSTIWHAHEEYEEIFFKKLEKKGFKIPIKKILLEHGKLSKYWKAINKAIGTKNENKIKLVLKEKAIPLIKEIREHKEKEELILISIPQEE